MGIWLVDPETHEPLPAKAGERPPSEVGHWKPGWRSGWDRDENGVPVRMWFVQCPDECCAEVRAAWKAAGI